MSYYNEFNYRSQALFNEIEKGKFQEFDKDDLQKLNVLQRRAVQYVAYYIKVKKTLPDQNLTYYFSTPNPDLSSV